MAVVSTSYVNADTHGRAAFEALDSYTQQNLLSGSEPALEPAVGFPLPNSVSYAQFSVVGLNGAGKLVMATTGNVDPDDDIRAIGVLAHAAALGASGTGNGQVWLIGCFNSGADSPLVWDASFNTTAKKEAAFFGAPTPTRIICRQRLAPSA